MMRFTTRIRNAVLNDRRFIEYLVLKINSNFRYYFVTPRDIATLESSSYTQKLYTYGLASRRILNGVFFDDSRLKIKSVIIVALLMVSSIAETALISAGKKAAESVSHFALMVSDMYFHVQLCSTLGIGLSMLYCLNFNYNCNKRRLAKWVKIFESAYSKEIMSGFALTKAEYLKWWRNIRITELVGNVQIVMSMIVYVGFSILAMFIYKSNLLITFPLFALRFLIFLSAVYMPLTCFTLYSFCQLMNMSLQKARDEIKELCEDLELSRFSRAKYRMLNRCLTRLVFIARTVHDFDAFCKHQVGCAFAFHFFIPMTMALAVLEKMQMTAFQAFVLIVCIMYLTNMLVITLSGAKICQSFFETSKLLHHLILFDFNMKMKTKLMNAIKFFGDHTYEGVSVSGCFVMRYDICATIYLELANFVILLISLRNNL